MRRLTVLGSSDPFIITGILLREVTVIYEQLKEKTVSTSYLYRGKIINVRQDRVKDARGKAAFREVVEHPGAVAILALNQSNEVILVRQHRQPAAEVLLEIPAGKLEPDEEPLECARRELVEETGLKAEKWQELACFYTSPGFCDEIIYLFLAETLGKGEPTTSDPEENIRKEVVALPEAGKMIADGRIKDGKTIIALQYAMLQKKILTD